MIDRDAMDVYLRNDPDLEIDQHLDEGSYAVLVNIPGITEQYPEMRAFVIVTNRVNPIYIQLFVRVSPDHLSQAIQATDAIPPVGLGTFGEDSFALRYVLFADFSEPLALTNGLRAVAMAYGAYLKAGGEPI